MIFHFLLKKQQNHLPATKNKHIVESIVEAAAQHHFPYSNNSSNPQSQNGRQRYRNHPQGKR